MRRGRGSDRVPAHPRQHNAAAQNAPRGSPRAPSQRRDEVAPRVKEEKREELSRKRNAPSSIIHQQGGKEGGGGRGVGGSIKKCVS